MSEPQEQAQPCDPAEPVNFKTELLNHVPALRAFARSLCGNASHADDLTQESLLKAWASKESFNLGTNMRAWLFVILRNSFYSELRRRKREVEDPDGVRAGALSVAPGQHDGLELRDLRRGLALLPVEQREALILVGASGCSYEEAAAICGCAVGTIKSRVSRARRSLLAFFEPVEPLTEAADAGGGAGTRITRSDPASALPQGRAEP